MMINPVRSEKTECVIQNVFSYQESLSTVTVFRQSKSGPEVMGDGYLPFDHKPSDLYRIGSFFSVAIGQGSHYNTGLYGPLPVLGSGFNSIVYTTKIKDDEKFDPRMKGWNYLLVCFIYDRSLDNMILENRGQIESYLDSFFAKNNHLPSM